MLSCQVVSKRSKGRRRVLENGLPYWTSPAAKPYALVFSEMELPSPITRAPAMTCNPRLGGRQS